MHIFGGWNQPIIITSVNQYFHSGQIFYQKFKSNKIGPICMYNASQKTNPYDFLERLHQKSTHFGNFWQRQLHFIRSSAFASKPTAVSMATTADVLALWADFEQAIDQWIKRLRVFMKAKRKRTVWTLAVIGCLLQRRIVSNNTQVF